MITSQVQGVGFRPLVCRLARELGLAGRVWNDRHGVVVEAEGPEPTLEEWEGRLREQAVAPARIETLVAEPMAPSGAATFEIAVSDARAASREADVRLQPVPGTEEPQPALMLPAWVPPDLATCPECLAEMRTPGDRRFAYPFINCTRCGPRYTIIGGLPYDRPQTTMAAFAMCPACQAEYDDPTNRRFHAQPNACPDCGPHLTLTAVEGQWERAAALAEARRRLAAGQVVAIKGLGGFHLACDARNAAAVERLRRAKQRIAKPFAVMVRDLAAAAELAEMGPGEAALLASPARPIVVMRAKSKEQRAKGGKQSGVVTEGKGEGGMGLAAGVAPGQTTLGIFLPYTPLHHLLFAPPAPEVLVMTSGNRSEEPLAIADVAAEGWLAAGDQDDAAPRLADAVLGHNRAIRYRADDSVVRVMPGGTRVIRRGRGYAPQALDLGADGPAVVGLGGESKNACCLTLDHFVVLGPHVGDWGRFEIEAAYAEALENLLALWGVQPQAVGYDPHPGFAVSVWGRRRFAGLPQVPVQHHHAHIAAILAEHRRAGPVIGLAWDGTGWGPDGTVWGGEVLVADRLEFVRWAHLRYVPMPGGERAVREPWRMALAQAWDAAGAAGEAKMGDWLARARLQPVAPEARRRGVEQMLARGYPMPRTSSCGRLFDAVAALAGLGAEASYEGQLAVALEAAADGCDETGAPPAAYALRLRSDAERPWEMDTRPMVQAVLADVARDEKPGTIARRFHAALAQAAVEVCRAVRKKSGIATVALGGGSWQNARLLGLTIAGLEAVGFEVLTAAQVPVNDGGLALGQAVVAQARLMARKTAEAAAWMAAGPRGGWNVPGDSGANIGAV